MLGRYQRALFAPSSVVRNFSSSARCCVKLKPFPRKDLQTRDDDYLLQDDVDPIFEMSEEPLVDEAATITESETATAAVSVAESPEPAADAAVEETAAARLLRSSLSRPVPPERDPLVDYIASALTFDGRRHSAERRATRLLQHLHVLTRASASPLVLLRAAIQECSPLVRIARHRSSAKENLIPVALHEKQQARYAVQWILKASEGRAGRTVEERFAREVVNVLNGTSSAIRQKEQMHQVATVNRANVPASKTGRPVT